MHFQRPACRGFFRLPLWCKLPRVRSLSSTKRLSWNAVVLTLLSLQLVFGLQLQAARAVASPMPMAMHGMAREAPASSAAVGTAGDAVLLDEALQASQAPEPTQASQLTQPPHPAVASQPNCPKHSMPHDCCHANACQCQCVYTPGAIELPALSSLAASVAVPGLAATQFVAPRIDEFLRPPIV